MFYTDGVRWLRGMALPTLVMVFCVWGPFVQNFVLA